MIHLGHNRAVREIVSAAIQEDADAIAVSSYQGGHMEYFQYMVSMLKERDSAHIRVFGGGGGVIVREEIDGLHAAGMARVYSPDDGHHLGLRGMIDDMLSRCQPVSGGVELEQLSVVMKLRWRVSLPVCPTLPRARTLYPSVSAPCFTIAPERR